MRKGFTLIELLIVVAIIAILAAIAVPNFLEAQTRSKIARAKADMRTVDLATQSYVVDHNTEPACAANFNSSPGDNLSWWGFVSHDLTTPVAYLTSMPVMAFTDDIVTGAWKNLRPGVNSEQNQPYTFIRDSWTPSAWGIGPVSTGNAPQKVKDAYGSQIYRCEIFKNSAAKAGYILYTCGPDRLDTTVYGITSTYDPTNGTMSLGDIYTFGSGENRKDRIR